MASRVTQHLLSERAIGVLVDAAKGDLIRIPLVRPAAATWIAGSWGTVNATAMSLLNRGYIELSRDVVWLPVTRVDPRLRNRLKHVDGRIEVYRHTAAAWAAVRRQFPSAQVHAWLGPVPS